MELKLISTQAVSVDPKAGRALFYYSVEPQNSSTKPVVLWLSGGNFKLLSSHIQIDFFKCKK